MRERKEGREGGRSARRRARRISYLEQAGVHTRMHIKSCNTPQVHVAVDVVVVVQYYCFFVLCLTLL